MITSKILRQPMKKTDLFHTAVWLLAVAALACFTLYTLATT